MISNTRDSENRAAKAETGKGPPRMYPSASRRRARSGNKRY
jgi:hypothetical protein